MRCAQSSGEWPGARRTFREGRLDAGRVEDVGVRDEGGPAAAGEREGGVRRVDARDGGGWREDPPPEGRGRRDDAV